MTTLKMNSIRLFGLFALCFLGLAVVTRAQDFKISVGAGIGFAPIVTLDQANYSGVTTSIYGDMEYGKLMGRLQYTKPIMSTFNSDRLEDGNAYHGALGYRLDLQDKLSLGLLIGGGATVISYRAISDVFTNVSPQVGLEVIPVYRLSKHFSIQASARYYYGFEAGDRGDTSNLFDLGIGIRVSL